LRGSWSTGALNTGSTNSNAGSLLDISALVNATCGFAY